MVWRTGLLCVVLAAAAACGTDEATGDGGIAEIAWQPGEAGASSLPEGCSADFTPIEIDGETPPDDSCFGSCSCDLRTFRVRCDDATDGTDTSLCDCLFNEDRTDDYPTPGKAPASCYRAVAACLALWPGPRAVVPSPTKPRVQTLD
jgi:hypothetical protein